MKCKLILCLLALALTVSLAPSALAAAPPSVCYPVWTESSLQCPG